MEGKILLLCRQLDWRTGEMRRNYHLTLIPPPPYQHPSAFWSGKEEGKQQYIHVLALYQLALGSLLVIPILFPPLIFDHSVGKP